MRRLLALLILSVSFFLGRTDFALADGVGFFGGSDEIGTQSEYTQIAGDGSPDIAWPPGGVAPFAGTETVGHLEGTPRRFTPIQACKSVEPVIHIIELSAVSEAAVDEFWFQMVQSGECKNFPTGLIFWADEVVAEMKWGDGDPMYVVKGHDNTGLNVYVWLPTSMAKERGVPPPGSSELIPLI